MKKSWIVWGIVIFLFLVVVLWLKSGYNNMVTMNEGVSAQWKQVEVAYQARMDKTKNLLEIVKGAANFEKSTLQAVMEARSKATSIQINADNLTPEKLAEFQKAQSGFGSSLGRLMAVAENYPQLQAVQSFRDFQAQYEGMENRISVERRKFNEVVQAYNTFIRRFPNNILSGMFGFEKKAYFASDEKAKDAPDIKF
ncbi:MAG: LemA family protein [Bacteroidota bacterium]